MNFDDFIGHMVRLSTGEVVGPLQEWEEHSFVLITPNGSDYLPSHPIKRNFYHVFNRYTGLEYFSSKHFIAGIAKDADKINLEDVL